MAMIKLLLGDCLEMMAKLPSECVDLTITSPPYNLGNNHHTAGKRHNPYNDNLTEGEYQHQQIAVLAEIHRLTSANGSLFYNHKNRIKDGRQITPYEWLLKTDWVVKQELVWVNGSPNNDRIRFYPHTERIYWLAKSPKTKLFNAINATDVFKWSPMGTGGAHTRAFPILMPLDIISCFPDAKTVFDPYMGSGTVGAAARLKKRDFIGIEVSEYYYGLAQERIDVAENMFVMGTKRDTVQLGLDKPVV